LATGFYHFSVRGFGRGEAVPGAAYRSGGVLACAAYRAGERLHNHEQGAVYDFTSRADSVQETMILAPADAPAWAHDREKLWNQAEEMEMHRNQALLFPSDNACARGSASLPSNGVISMG
jgi:hypothetical protein